METKALQKEISLPFEYLLIISPDKNTSQKLAAIKQHFKQVYKCRFAAHLKPHITLIRFFQYQEWESAIKKEFQSFSDRIPPVRIELADFGQFPTHTIYVDVKNREPIQKIVDGMASQSWDWLKPVGKFKPYFSTKPHMTIARRMTGEQFRRGWEDWKDKHFEAVFEAPEMVLLKKQWNQEGKPIGPYKEVAKFSFRKEKEGM